MIDIIKTTFDISLIDPRGRFLLGKNRETLSNGIRCGTETSKAVRIGSANVSDTGSRVSSNKACIALSFMVGIPNGRFFPLLLGI